jgi:hypothetical protein
LIAFGDKLGEFDFEPHYSFRFLKGQIRSVGRISDPPARWDGKEVVVNLSVEVD